MKKILLLIITTICLALISWTSTTRVNANNNTITKYEYTSCMTMESNNDGGVFFVTSVGHNDIVNMYFDEQKSSITITDDMWIHIKGIVSSEIYRIKVNADGVTCQSRLFDTSRPDIALVQLNEDKTFEVHCKASEFFKAESLSKLAFQVYITGDDHLKSSHNENLELLGIVFNNNENYNDWATPVEREEHTCVWNNEWTADSSYHWHTCINGCKATKDFEQHEYVEGVCKECGTPEPGELNFGSMTANTSNVSVENNGNGIGKITFIEDGTAKISIPTENVLTTSHTWLSVKLNLSADVVIAAYADNVCMCTDLLTAWNAKNYLETYDEFYIANVNVGKYLATLSSVSNLILRIDGKTGDEIEIFDITLTSDGVHGFDVPVIEPVVEPISKISIPKGFDATSIINDKGEQTITYSSSPLYKTFDIQVKEYDFANTILEIIFEASAETTVCIQINNKIDWSLGGHKAYPGERTSKIQIDLTSYDYELTSDFIISIFIDATSTVESEKSITFKSIKFKTPDPEPEGMYISEPTASEMSCVENALGWEAKWDFGGWANVNFPVKKYETDYDILIIKMLGIKGMNLGVRIVWLEEINGEMVENSYDIRNHWYEEGIITITGNMELVFFLEEFGLQGKNITNVILYFDPPTENYTPNAGEQNTMIYSVDFYKSSEQTFDELTITANPMTVDYSGEPINFVATSNHDVGLIIEYSVNGSWTKQAPTKAGTYSIRVIYHGSLLYKYQTVTSTLTINKVKASIDESYITIDKTTGVITIPDGIIVSTNEDFTNDSLVKDGNVVEDNTTLYFFYKGDENHSASDTMSLTVQLDPKQPTEPTQPTPQEPEQNEPTPEDPTIPKQPSKEEKNNKGYIWIIIGSIVGIALTTGIVLFLVKKKNN